MGGEKRLNLLARELQERGCQPGLSRSRGQRFGCPVLSELARCSTGPGEWLPRGHRSRTELSRWSANQALERFVRDREWCPDAITNSLCVNRVLESQLLNTAERLPLLAQGIAAEVLSDGAARITYSRSSSLPWESMPRPWESMPRRNSLRTRKRRACLVHAVHLCRGRACRAEIASEPASRPVRSPLANAIHIATAGAGRRAAGSVRVEAIRAVPARRVRVGSLEPPEVALDPACGVAHVGDPADGHREDCSFVEGFRVGEIHLETLRVIVHEPRCAQARHPQGHNVHRQAGVHMIRMIARVPARRAVLKK